MKHERGTITHRSSDEIEFTHPAFAGHFPGNPIVPGVVILARVSKTVERAFQSSIAAIGNAKFHTPLKPAEKFEVELSRAEDLVEFRVLRAGDLIANGSLRLTSAQKAS